MADQRHGESQANLTEAFARLDLMESRISSLEESVGKAVRTLMPKVDSLLSGRSLVPSESGSSTSVSATLPTSILHLAEQGDGEALLQFLADEQVHIRSSLERTKKGDTALHVAASNGHVKAVMVLVGAVVKVDAPGHRLRTPLHCAAAHGHLAVAQRLLLAGAQVDAKDADGHTPLGLAAEQGNVDVANFLLQKGARLNEEVVSLAVENGFGDLVALFLQNKKSFVDSCNEEGDPLIVLAAKANRWEMVQMLLEKGASATKSKDVKESALVLASQAGQAGAVRELLRRGGAANGKQMEFALKKAKSAAVVWAFGDVVPHVLQGRSGEWGFLYAAMNSRLEALGAFLEAGVDINATDNSNGTALFFSAQDGRLASVRELLRRGADANKKHQTGNTPLHKASMNGHVECVRALLEAGASKTERNNEGVTPREVAFSGDIRVLLTPGLSFFN